MAHPIYDVPLTSLSGEPVTLRSFEGQVMLIVNVASKCGFTPQYEALQALYAARKDQGLAVLGFPANDFADQEPGSESEIAGFCTTTYGVDFPMFGKVHVTGPEKHPLYRALTESAPPSVEEARLRDRLSGYGLPPAPPGEVVWNFEKFLLDRRGRVVGRFSSLVTPDAEPLLTALDRELSAGAAVQSQG